MASILSIAFRGALHQAPENTIPAIEKAVEAGAEMVALDVQGSKDHEPMVFADARLDRTTNVTGRLAQLTAKEIKALDAGSWFKAEFKGTAVPTLAEALKALGKKARMMLVFPEIRGEGPLAENVRKALKARATPAGDVLVFSDSESLKSFREKAPDFGYALALGEKVSGWVCVEKASKLGLKIVRPHRQQADAEFVRNAHAKGLQVFVHYADEEEDLRELVALRVDGIVTGRLERLKHALAEAKA